MSIYGLKNYYFCQNINLFEFLVGVKGSFHIHPFEIARVYSIMSPTRYKNLQNIVQVVK